MEFAMNVSQQIFVVFFAIFWGTSSNAWPKWKAFHWTLAPFSCRVLLRLVLSVTVLNVIPVLYFIGILKQLGGCIQGDPFSTFPCACRVVLPAVIPAFAVFGFYRMWISVVEFCPTRFYYREDTEIAAAIPNRDMARLGETRVDPTIQSLNIKDWTWCPNLLFGALYLVVATVVPLAWPPVR